MSVDPKELDVIVGYSDAGVVVFKIISVQAQKIRIFDQRVTGNINTLRYLQFFDLEKDGTTSILSWEAPVIPGTKPGATFSTDKHQVTFDFFTSRQLYKGQNQHRRAI